MDDVQYMDNIVTDFKILFTSKMYIHKNIQIFYILHIVNYWDSVSVGVPSEDEVTSITCHEIWNSRLYPKT